MAECSCEVLLNDIKSINEDIEKNLQDIIELKEYQNEMIAHNRHYDIYTLEDTSFMVSRTIDYGNLVVVIILVCFLALYFGNNLRKFFKELF